MELLHVQRGAVHRTGVIRGRQPLELTEQVESMLLRRKRAVTSYEVIIVDSLQANTTIAILLGKVSAEGPEPLNKLLA